MLKRLTSNRSIKYSALGLLVLVLLTVPLWGTQYLVMLFLLISLYVAFAQMWNLLAGYAGLISLGQQIFIGLGGYTLAVLTEYYGLTIWQSILMGGLISGVVAAFLAFLLFRMKGVYFTIASWITAEIMVVVFSNWAYVRQGMGIFIRSAYKLSTNDIYYAALALGISSVILVQIILRSKLGLGLMAMRDNEGAAETMGVEIFKSKLYCFIISAVVTGFTGGVLYLSQAFIQPTAAFSISWTVAVIFIVIIGGIGTVVGPIVGAVIYVLLQQFLSQYVGIGMLILGVMAITVILIAPKGIMGTLQQKLRFEIFSSRRI
ncbi:branched-chain amino acid ABC transporter permease [Desulfosporosinus fructosivorans]|uniref:Branched-chain amino acid ABC transporter permease n=1 Tax=Desulfosporosinus fructosivorans TaxID=2018669 RepID=A0A4Z0R800_9FIRM|nr:branched-chain amino acid ABC transporter permease [Desulfosporosinus fructosivorans]